ncbi:MAG: zinc-binding dehydrogenase [Bacteroidales bacterium]|nr:zinc-binding dehydrogenase [Bacteroidales bacterium]
MKAIYLIRHGESRQAFEIRETEIPKAGKNEVVIKVKASGLNFADVMARRGLYQDAPPLPSVLGYDVAGTVFEVGSGVQNLKVGDEVLAMTRFGGYAEYAKTQASGVVPIPEGFSPAHATALAVQALTAYYAAGYMIRLNPGDKVLVQAASGGVGSIIVQLAKHHGCTVFGTASTGKQEYLRNLGVDHPIDYTREDFYTAVRQKAGQKGVDAVFDNLGGKAFSRGLKLLAPGGKLITYGAASMNKGKKSGMINTLRVAWGFGFRSPVSLIGKSQSIIGVNMLRIADHHPEILKQCMQEVINLTKQKVIRPSLSQTFPANQIAEAHDFLEQRKSRGKVALLWDNN